MREGEKFRVELVGKFVRLEPLGLDHALGLLAAADEEAFGLMPTRPDQWDTGGFRHYVERLTRMANHQAFAVLAKDTGRVIGSTSYADIRQEHRGVEIGYTWLTSDARGGAANPEMKRLMLAHVFENPVFPKGPAIRVTLKTDRLNERSQRAIEKLGRGKGGRAATTHRHARRALPRHGDVLDHRHGMAGAARRPGRAARGVRLRRSRV